MAKLPPVIFDLDGLLADTEYLHCRAYQMAFLECGLDLQDCDYAEHWVRHGKGISDWVALRRLSLDPQALRLRKAEHYLALLSSSLRPLAAAPPPLRIGGSMKATTLMRSAPTPNRTSSAFTALPRARQSCRVCSGARSSSQ